MSRINTNTLALRAVAFLHRNQADLAVRLERLATGLRINRGRDDPTGLIVSENLRSEIRTIQQAIANSTRANNVISTAEGAISEVSALLLELQGLVVATANESGLIEEEVRANQLAVDFILASIDRIGQTTAFGQDKLLDGSKDYLLSAVPPTQLASVSIFAARVPTGGTRNVAVEVTQSAETAQISLVGANAGGVSTTSATTIDVRGTLGSTLLSFASGTTLADIRDALNTVTDVTGVSVVVSAPVTGGAASALLVNSTTFGSDAFVSVKPISGNFIVNGNSGTIVRDVGVDAGVLINNQPATVQGLRADLRTDILDTRIYLTQPFGQSIASTNFSITGGGARFQLAPEISPNGQINVGFSRISAADLGNSVTGMLHTLRSGAENDLAGKNFSTAQNIVEDAIEQVASLRGRLGSIQKEHLETNINSQSITLENVTASESVIRDADIAVEVSALTRAQILVQSAHATLLVANSIPKLVLALLE
ncbi:MAG: flagellin N-terminal helical domain-containing protein [Planctomycetota bacterium]|jgi:flagellin